MADSHSSIWELTSRLRYLITDKYWPNPRLQQAERCLENGEIRWRDVPVEVQYDR
jgi:hypothetical protein